MKIRNKISKKAKKYVKSLSDYGLIDENVRFDVMVDIETVNDEVDSAILAIALIIFDIKTGVEFDTLYLPVDLQSCINHGLSISADTLSWWLGESPDQLVALLKSKECYNIVNALYEIKRFLAPYQKYDLYLWGNSNRFDLGILTYAFKKILGDKAPWKFYNERDVRTLVDIPDIIASIDGNLSLMNNFKGNAVADNLEKHNPVADCRTQIKYCVEILNHLNTHLF